MSSATQGLSAATQKAYEGPSQPASQGGAKVLGEDDFFQLLVTQLRYQNPLSPIGNTEYVAQLAQFTSLEQMRKVNENLTYLQMYQASINNSMAVSLIGKEVKVGTRQLRLSGGESNRLWYRVDADAADVRARIFDRDGSLVREVKLGSQEKGDYTFEWDGKDSSGSTVSDGDYTFEIVATDTDGGTVSVDYGVRARVTGVSFSDGVTYLVLGNQSVPLSEITEVYEGGSQDGESSSGNGSDSGSSQNSGVAASALRPNAENRPAGRVRFLLRPSSYFLLP